MSRYIIKFRMNNSNNDAMKFETKGILNNNILKFQDEEKCWHFINLENNNSISYIRKSTSHEMDFKFENGERTLGLYKYLGREFEFYIKTKELLVTNEKIMIKYCLMNDDVIESSHTISIYYQMLEE